MTAAWVSVWPAVSRFSDSKRRHGARGGCQSLTLPQRQHLQILSLKVVPFKGGQVSHRR